MRPNSLKEIQKNYKLDEDLITFHTKNLWMHHIEKKECVNTFWNTVMSFVILGAFVLFVWFILYFRTIPLPQNLQP